MNHRILIFSLLYLLLNTSVHAQKEEPFGEILFRAHKEYESGNFNEAMVLTSSCSIDKASISDQWKAYRLNTLIYLALGKTKEARSSAEQMLELNPTYQPNYLKDPAELIKLLRSIRVIPKLSLGMAISLGTNSTIPIINKSYVLSDYRKTYEVGNSFLFGVSGSYNINEHLGIQFGCFASRKVYSISYKPANWLVTLDEKLNYIDLPLTARFTLFPRRKVHLFAEAGVFTGFLVYSNSTFKAVYIPDGYTRTLENVNSSDRHAAVNFGFTYSIGTSMQVKEGVIFAQVSFYQSLLSLTNSNNRYHDNELKYNYFYLEDDIKLNNLSATIGYSFFLNYKVIKSK